RWQGSIALVLGFRTPRDFVFQNEITDLQSRNPKIRVAVTMSNPGEEVWSGPRGHISAELLSGVPEISRCRAHICGPPLMMSEVKTMLRTLGIPENEIRTEAFGTVTRDPTTKGARSVNIAGNVHFQASDTTTPVSADATILDVADEIGVFIDNACRSGTCAS